MLIFNFIMLLNVNESQWRKKEKESKPVFLSSHIRCFKFLNIFLYIGLVFVLVEKYIPPLLQCNNCQWFGHRQTNCQMTTPTCPHCAGNHTFSDCRQHNLTCANCHGGPHMASSKDCTVYNWETEMEDKVWYLRLPCKVDMMTSTSKCLQLLSICNTSTVPLHGS